MKRIDDRTPEQKKTHRYLVVAKDKFMSDWGQASQGDSWCAWAYETLTDARKGLKWVQSRSEMRYVRIAHAERFRPSRNCAHFHIYVTEQGHPSLTHNL